MQIFLFLEISDSNVTKIDIGNQSTIIAFEKIAKMKNIRCIIITGMGAKAFIAGADIKNMSNMNNVKALEFSKYGPTLTICN